MTTIKSYTDLSQSKKLSEILLKESADMGWYYSRNPQAARNQMWLGTKAENADIPCWSLAALRNLLPVGIKINENTYLFGSHNTFDKAWVYRYYNEEGYSYLYTKEMNEIDACYELILKLNELNLL